jgi:hypothetical protein
MGTSVLRVTSTDDDKVRKLGERRRAKRHGRRPIVGKTILKGGGGISWLGGRQGRKRA